MSYQNQISSQQAAKRPSSPQQPREHKPLREEVRDIDQQIMRLLLRRHNLLEKMRKNGRINPEEEKYLRESWQKGLSKISRDADLASRFFAIMQAASFLPRPQSDADESPTPRQAFNLAPPKRPVRISMTGALDSSLARAWIYLACAAGSPLTLSPVLQSDSMADFLKALEQMGHTVSRSGELVTIREQAPLATPDKVVYVGNSRFNLFILLAHYLGQPARVKFTGGTGLKIADMSALGHFLPALGARLVHIIPRSEGLPVRVECSGLLPPELSFPDNLDERFAEALLFAAPFFKHPFSLDISGHPARESIMARVLPVLVASAVPHSVDGGTIAIEPGRAEIPQQPVLPMDGALASVLLALGALLGGSVELKGVWPTTPVQVRLGNILSFCNLRWQILRDRVEYTAQTPLNSLELADLPDELLPARECMPLLAGMTAAVALNGGAASCPPAWLEDPVAADFYACASLAAAGNGCLKPADKPAPWTAPNAEWAMALALAACGKPAQHLVNPGIMTTLWPGFWALYNSLPAPQPKTEPRPTAEKQRRRILTSAVATPPETHDDD